MNEAFKKFDLTGKTAFITGGGAGLGYNMTRALAQSGATVMMAARREDVLKMAAEQLTAESAGNTVLYTTVDLVDKDSIKRAADYAIETMGGVDIFVGNAAMDSFEKIDGINDDVVEQVFQVNVNANIALLRQFLPHMRNKQWGRIIYSSSITAIRGSAHEGMASYAATKGALNSFARVAASEAGHDNITINCINLGVYITDMLEGVLDNVAQDQGQAVADGMIAQMASMTSLGRLGKGEEIEGLIQLLASDAGSYITGTPIVLDGGMSANMKANG